MNKKNRMSYIKEIFIILSISILYVFGTLFITGTFFSGYHLQDDHEIIRRGFNYRTYNTSIETLFSGFPWAGMRFRPLYSLVRNLRIFLFGNDFAIWYTIVGLEMVFSIVTAYYIARMWKCNAIISVLFGLLIITGEQSAIWWRLGPQEPLGLLLLLLSILAVQKYEVNRKIGWLLINLVTAILCSWSKEAFTLILPAIPLIGISYDLMFRSNETNLFKAIVLSTKRNLITIIILAGIFMWNMYIIIFKVGLLSIGYAGIDTSYGIGDYVSGIMRMATTNLKIYFIGIVVAIVIYLAYLGSASGRKNTNKTVNKQYIVKLLPIMIVSLGAWSIQLVLHAKSGMWERYLVPMTVAWCFICVIMVGFLIHEKKHLIYLQIAVLGILLCYLWCGKVLPAGRGFAMFGNELKDCFEIVNESVDKDALVVSAMSDEYNVAMESYLEIELGYTSVYCYVDEVGLTQRVNINDTDILLNDLSEADYIICYNDREVEGFEPINCWGFGKLLRRK